MLVSDVLIEDVADFGAVKRENAKDPKVLGLQMEKHIAILDPDVTEVPGPSFSTDCNDLVAVIPERTVPYGDILDRRLGTGRDVRLLKHIATRVALDGDAVIAGPEETALDSDITRITDIEAISRPDHRRQNVIIF